MTIDTTHLASKPESLGIESEKLEAVFARAKRDVDDGTLPSAQIAVARHGKLAGMRTYGSAVQGGADKPATDETLYHVFSSTKAIVAAAVWLLFESGDLRLDEKVADIIPEFGTNGKDAIDVETLMLHAGGFPLAPFAADKWGDREALLQAFQQWRLNWPVDSRYEYHATSMHWVLSEIIYRRGGAGYKTFIRERITGPMGLDELFVGCPPEQQHRVADVRYMSEPVPPPGGWGEVTPEAILRFNQPKVREAGVPGGGRVASAASMALFYQPLINGGVTASGTRIMKAETIEFATKVRARPNHIDRDAEVPGPEAQREHEPRARRRGRRRRRLRGLPRLWPDVLREGLRSRRRRRADRLGRPGHRDLDRLLHQRLRRCDGDGPADHRARKPGRELRLVAGTAVTSARASVCPRRT